ncbi:hypothetical protein AVEN_23497-1 [Araneus ventricosus]|uniref:Uncharacterized protein n=1 Tax=Araneus ventricosus TaxID=182803 RepID=A0A4Y2USY1_ARAVE|nr:hypothetical protein AVEN_23497-1 [Araneus ventricosus]
MTKVIPIHLMVRKERSIAIRISVTVREQPETDLDINLCNSDLIQKKKEVSRGTRYRTVPYILKLSIHEKVRSAICPKSVFPPSI